jgi:hypothetical protein
MSVCPRKTGGFGTILTGILAPKDWLLQAGLGAAHRKAGGGIF